MKSHSSQHMRFAKLFIFLSVIISITYCTKPPEVPITINIFTSTPKYILPTEPIETQTSLLPSDTPSTLQASATPYPKLTFLVYAKWKCENFERAIILSVSPSGGKLPYTILPEKEFRARPGSSVPITVSSNDGQSESLTLLVPTPPASLKCGGGGSGGDEDGGSGGNGDSGSENGGGGGNPTTKWECNDNVDNDGDKLVDYPADPGCKNAHDKSE